MKTRLPLFRRSPTLASTTVALGVLLSIKFLSGVSDAFLPPATTTAAARPRLSRRDADCAFSLAGRPSPSWLRRSSSSYSSLPLFGKRPRSVVEAESDLDDVRDPPPSSVSVDGALTTSSAKGDLEPLVSASVAADTEPNFLRDRILMGIEPTPDVVAIATIYFVEGALGLARLAQTFLLKDEMHLGPAEMSALSGLFVLPWTIKPLYGFLSDGFPIAGYRRRSYLLLAGFLGFLSYAALASSFGGIFDGDGAGDKGHLLQATIASLLLSSACIAMSDVVADGIVVQKTREASERGEDPKLAGGLQSLCWGSASLGALLSAYFSGSLLEVMTPRHVFGIASVLPLTVAAIALIIDETPVGRAQIEVANGVNGDNDETTVKTVNANEAALLPSGDDTTTDRIVGDIAPMKEQIELLWSTLRQPSIWRPVLFIFLWQSTPTSDGAMLYFMTNDIGFGPEFLGRVRVVAAASSLLGVWLYQKYLRDVAIKDILFWTSIASAPIGLTQLLLIYHVNRDIGIPDGAFVFGDDVVQSVLGELAFLPTLVLAARICPPGVEAVLFATLMSIYNGASTVGTEIGAALTKYLGVTETDFSNLGLLTTICCVTSLYPLFFIGWLDEVGSESEEEIEARERALLGDDGK